jgi:hypothetical protein
MWSEKSWMVMNGRLMASWKMITSFSTSCVLCSSPQLLQLTPVYSLGWKNHLLACPLAQNFLHVCRAALVVAFVIKH